MVPYYDINWLSLNKVLQETGHIQFICSIDENKYEEIMLCDSINNHIVYQE